LESFPSGHTASAFAGAIFLSLYLNAKFKLLANYQPHFWKLIIVLAPILGATIQGGVLTIDGFHQGQDIIAGAIIGTLFAFFAYRMMYAALFDFRFNHIPLSKHHGFLYHADDGHYATLCNTVFTHKVGWGTKGTFCLSGAPGDVWVHQVNLNGSPSNTYPNTAAGTTKKTQDRTLNDGFKDCQLEDGTLNMC
jgi:diacylglycerol diphosphate phosphatase / phosphatidate phosphatase